VHAAGWVHGDPHAGNVLVGPGGPVLLDWQRARRSRAASARRRDLARLEHALAPSVGRAGRLRLRAAALGLARPFDAWAREALRAAGRAADARAAEHARSRTRHAARAGRLATVAQARGARGLRLKEVASDTLERLLEAHHDALAARDARVLECDERGRITAVAADGLRAVVKETPWRGPARALADAVRGSAARRAWRAGHGLAARGLAGARPLAFLERRRLGVALASWLVLEDLRPGAPAALALERALAPPEQVLDVLAALCLALHRRGVDHADLKGTNVWLRRGTQGLEARLLDLEDVRFRRRLRDPRRLRALAQLNASLPDAFPAAARRRAFARYARALPFAAGAPRALAQVVAESLARRHRWSGAGCTLATNGEDARGAPR
jgi:hypothetical protein